jgi:XamI-like restriction endonuclease
VTPSRPLIRPLVLTKEQLERGRETAVARFIEERGREGTEAYRAAFNRIEPIVRRLFAASNDLAAISGDLLRREPDFVAAARYLAGPPISADDLRTLTGGAVGRRLPPETAQRVAEVLRAIWDPIRLPWLASRRAPTKHERESAIAWTAGIWAVEQVRTSRRTEASRRQENAVVAILKKAGFNEKRRIRTMKSLDELERGCFMREVTLAGSKCDVPIRLRDGRLLALECKVSNSALNSVKRLIRETGGKARRWHDAFGEQVVTGVVLAGVYKLGNLVDAQETFHVALFWQHDLTRLRRYIMAARSQ